MVALYDGKLCIRFEPSEIAIYVVRDKGEEGVAKAFEDLERIASYLNAQHVRFDSLYGKRDGKLTADCIRIKYIKLRGGGFGDFMKKLMG